MSHHDALWAVCRKLPEDYRPYGNAQRDGHDCSGGCMLFYALKDRGGEYLGYDWGVCTNPKSHRCGLLTFEHQGCPQFASARLT